MAHATQHATRYPTATPMTAPQQQAARFGEGRIALGVQAYKLGQVKSLRGIEKTYDVSRKTVKRHVSGIQPRHGSPALNRRLTLVQEESLKEWILSMDQRGMLPKIATVRQMASILATQGTKQTNPVTVGQNWVRNFINRHNDLKSKYNRKYDHQRAKCEGPVLIQTWFKRVQDTNIL
jgi:Tc5 transposase DNA-binding domain